MSERILRSACITVVWSRPPNCWPIFGSERSVSSRHRYIAIWRAVTSTRDRDVPHRSSIDSPKYEAVWPMMVAAVISGPCASGMRSLSTISDQLEVDGLAVQAGEGGHPDERAFELPDVGGDPARDVLQRLRWRVEPFLDRFLTEDRDARLQFRWLDVGEQAPFEPAAQPVFEGHQALGRAVAGDDDLLARVVQRVEGVEELLLRSFLVLQELDVVDQQHVDVAVAAAEAVLLAVPDHVDEVVGELLRADVPDLQAGVQGLRVVPDGV